MKEVIFLIVSILIVIISGFAEINYFEQSSQYVLADINHSKNAIDNNNFEIAKEHIEQTKNTWDNIKKTWIIFIEHGEVDSIENDFLMFESFIKSNNKEMAIVYSNKLESNLKNIIEKHKLRVENIL